MADNASRDENNVPTLLAALSTDGVTPIRVKVVATDHALEVSDGTLGTDHGPVNDLRDDNFVPALMAVSSADGKTPVVVYATSSGMLLIQSS